MLPGGICQSPDGYKINKLIKRMDALEKEVGKISASHNKQSESLLCPKCQSKAIHWSVLDKDYWCDECHHRWEA